MPFHEVSRMDARLEFVMLASAEGANIRQLCRRFGISPTTGYKWLERWRLGGTLGFRSCRVGRTVRRRAALQRRSKQCFRCVRSIRPGAAARSPGG